MTHVATDYVLKFKMIIFINMHLWQIHHIIYLTT